MPGSYVRGAKYETAACYADQAFLKPDARRLGPTSNCRTTPSAASSEWGRTGVKHLCRSGFAGRASAADYPLANRFDEVDTLVVLDDVLVPWEDVFFYRHTRAASVYPRHPAPLFGLPLRAAHSLHRRYDDRRGIVERAADRSR